MKKHPDWYRAQSLEYAARSIPPKIRKPRRRKAKPAKTRKQKYRAYLNSPEWKTRRLLLINERGSQCDNCGKVGPVQVHHLNYERLGRELPFDLQLLCRGCHAMTHGK